MFDLLYTKQVFLRARKYNWHSEYVLDSVIRKSEGKRASRCRSGMFKCHRFSRPGRRKQMFCDNSFVVCVFLKQGLASAIIIDFSLVCHSSRKCIILFRMQKRRFCHCFGIYAKNATLPRISLGYTLKFREMF